jgi:hypothetical protein
MDCPDEHPRLVVILTLKVIEKQGGNACFIEIFEYVSRFEQRANGVKLYHGQFLAHHDQQLFEFGDRSLREHSRILTTRRL